MPPAPAFTVYTPTYNRAHTLHRCYDSLKAQTLRDFEWLIVDVGSTDGTASLVAQWQAEALVPIRYEPRPHLGAHHAHNHGLLTARGLLWIKLDSDDGCVPEALERFWHHWQSIPEAARSTFSGVTALCRDHEGRLVGTPFPIDPLDCSAAELEYVHKVRGEKWGFLRTEVLRAIPYPENVPGNFIAESYLWCQVSSRYKTRHVNEQLRIYWTDAPSLVHGRPNPFTNAAGHRLMFGMVLNLEARWFTLAPLRLLRAAVQYVRFGLLSGVGLTAQWKDLRPGAKILWLFGTPVGCLLFVRDRLRQSG
ncbi:MAG TPA: glycosyltransferase family A protein [Prosthecobacter sp.]|nr:glycosyltransferase family A protein [Prosthecobacter sp.]